MANIYNPEMDLDKLPRFPGGHSCPSVSNDRASKSSDPTDDLWGKEMSRARFVLRPFYGNPPEMKS